VTNDVRKAASSVRPRLTKAQKDLAAHLELSGLAVDVRTTGSVWEVPGGITVEDGWLLYDPAQRSKRNVWDPNTDFLTAFANLTQAPDLAKAVASFAGRWGVLGVCQHGLPNTHRPVRMPTKTYRDLDGCGLITRTKVRAEPLTAWKMFAGQARVMLLGILAERGDEPALAEGDWEALLPLFPEGIPPRRRTRMDGLRKMKLIPPDQVPSLGMGVIGAIDVLAFPTDRQALAYAIRRWLDLGDVRPVLMWREGPDFGFGAQTLFGALALRMAYRAAGVRALKLCHYCEEFYEPKPGEKAATRCCTKAGCNAERATQNWQNKRAGRAKKRGDYGPRHRDATP